MSLLVEILIVELGISAQPFQESFKKYKDWVTWSWMVSVWEKCDMFKVVIDINDNLLKSVTATKVQLSIASLIHSSLPTSRRDFHILI